MGREPEDLLGGTHDEGRKEERIDPYLILLILRWQLRINKPKQGNCRLKVWGIILIYIIQVTRRGQSSKSKSTPLRG